MKRARLLSIAASLALAGCATPPTIVELPPDHPANPAASEAPAPPESSTLSFERTPKSPDDARPK
ncbi:MAG: hypothetical protein HYR85_08215 [Planctomycetes bacterium]|nr:hypothetical protein [Planctomycetota bacterium]